MSQLCKLHLCTRVGAFWGPPGEQNEAQGGRNCPNLNNQQKRLQSELTASKPSEKKSQIEEKRFHNTPKGWK